MKIALGLLWLSGQLALAQATGSIQGHVTDSSGTPIYAAVVTVEESDGNRHTTATDLGGAFKISSLPPGDYSVKISASGLSEWTASNVPAAESPQPLQAVLQVATEVTTITVSPPLEEVAAEQLHQELQQRVFGVIPNYYVTYERHPAPLSPPQKLHLGLKSLLDPTTFAATGTTTAIQQEMNSYWQWGQGAKGFAKRFGAGYGTAVQQIMITSVLADSVLHQDPRYFYSGQGTRGQRAWCAVKSAFRAKGDNGKWQPPYAGLIGAVASAEISQTYYPGSRTQYTLLGRSMMFHFAGLIALNLGEEFFFKRLTSHTPKLRATADLPVLQEGTAVPLIAVDGFSAEGPAPGQTLTFVLARELTVRGQTLAKAGDVASGQVSQVNASNTPGEPVSVALDRVMLHSGNVIVPLRSSQVRDGVSPMQFKESPESGKVEVTLFVAENVQFPEGQ
ncbi:MAG: carboxypeptidase regulatory-like domain-containing protein [Acidobacteriia bacterium]|nr:carboxypeptidase regulatory-like domain-containing protein [Terriglobia bacterium]